MTRDDLNDRTCQELVPVARALVHAVHHGDQSDVRAILRWLGHPLQRVALTVVLAAMVDPTADPADLLAWTEQRRPGEQPAGWADANREQPAGWADANREQLEDDIRERGRLGPRAVPVPVPTETATARARAS